MDAFAIPYKIIAYVEICINICFRNIWSI